MLTIKYKIRFKKDLKKFKHLTNKITKVKEIINYLTSGKSLPTKYKSHHFIGTYIGCQEFHIAPNLLLIYKFTEKEIIFERIGSHSELFS